MQADPQIASRFEPLELPRWRESAKLQDFVVSFGRLLPLHLPSPFGDRDMIQKLMAYSGCLTGRITTLLAQAAELAIRQKTECISLDLLDQAASAGIFRILVEEETDVLALRSSVHPHRTVQFCGASSSFEVLGVSVAGVILLSRNPAIVCALATLLFVALLAPLFAPFPAPPFAAGKATP